MVLSAGCTPSVKKVRAVVDGFQKRRIAVMPFKDLPTDPNSGEAAQARICQKLAEVGFIMVNRADLDKILTEQRVQSSGVVDPAQATQLGKLSGADTVMTGVVGEAGTRYVTRPAVYGTQYQTYVASDGTLVQQPIQVLVTPAYSGYEARYSISIQFTYLDTGEIVWSDSESSVVENGTVDDAARDAVDKIISRLFKDIVKSKKM